MRFIVLDILPIFKWLMTIGTICHLFNEENHFWGFAILGTLMLPGTLESIYLVWLECSDSEEYLRVVAEHSCHSPRWLNPITFPIVSIVE